MLIISPDSCIVVYSMQKCFVLCYFIQIQQPDITSIRQVAQVLSLFTED